MAKGKKAKPGASIQTKTTRAVVHSENAPCQQMFNVGAKPGTKRKSWWNGHRPSAKPAEL